MKMAGLEIPAKLEFGNEEHIRLREQIEKRLNLIEKGIKCCCGAKTRMKGTPYWEKNIIKWSCRNCGDDFATNADGEGFS